MAKKPETLNTRVTRLEEATVLLLEAQAHMDRTLSQLAKEAAAREKAAAAREARAEERIEKLVSAIGELIRRMDERLLRPSA